MDRTPICNCARTRVVESTNSKNDKVTRVRLGMYVKGEEVDPLPALEFGTPITEGD